MRIHVVSDVHGASEALSRAADGADALICLGDLLLYIDYDDRVHLAVTVDDDPGQQLMRETGRYLFFFANEVEPA